MKQDKFPYHLFETDDQPGDYNTDNRCPNCATPDELATLWDNDQKTVDIKKGNKQ